MKKLICTAICSSLLFGSVSMAAMMPDTVMVGGAAMYPSKNIIENALNAKDHTTLVAAVKAAGLVDTLQGSGPFTVFAPTNEAFAKLPAGTVDTLLKPENKAALTGVLMNQFTTPNLSNGHRTAKSGQAINLSLGQQRNAAG